MNLDYHRAQHYELAAGRDAPACGNCGHEAGDHEDAYGCYECLCVDYDSYPTDDDDGPYDTTRERWAD